jgi:HSP20 family protein
MSLNELIRMDLRENADGNTVTATFDLPGLKKEDVQIDIHNGLLTVSGELGGSTSEKAEGGYAVRERRCGKFSRSLRLPQGIKVSGNPRPQKQKH